MHYLLRKLIGSVAVVMGVLLFLRGYNESQLLIVPVKNILTGAPVQRALYYEIAGGALVLYGLIQIAWPRK